MATRAVIFDLFGTLAPSYSAREANRTLAAMADVLGMPATDFLPWWNKRTWPARLTGELPSVQAAVERICRALDVPVSPEQVAAATSLRLDFARWALRPKPAAIATLTELRHRGLRLGLISDCSADVPAVWAESAFAPLVASPVFSCEAGFTKPDPRIYALAWERLAVPPAACLYVGDGSSHELSGAAAAGMRPVLLRTRYDHCPDPVRPDVDGWQGPEISDIAEVLALVAAS